MQQCTYLIQDKYGMHARPAGMLVSLAQTFDANITVTCRKRNCSLKRLMPVMALGIHQGDTITVTAEGPDEAACIQALAQFLTENV